MTVSLALLILGLALLDSTSLGTSLIPLWLLLVPGRVRWVRIGAYFVTITGAYFLMGLAVAAGALQVFAGVQRFVEEISAGTLAWAQFGAGVLLVLAGSTLLVRTLRARGRQNASSVLRWRNEAMAAGNSRGLIRLALLAFAVEFVSMVPYVGAIGLLVQTGMGWQGIVGWVAVYCFVMILPALMLTAVRSITFEKVEPFLVRADGWLERNVGAVSGSGLSVLGTLIAAGAVGPLVA